MPYEVPDQPDDDASADRHERHRERIQEREVRLTAQRLLKVHLTPGHEATYWGPCDLDLTGAQLIDFDLSGARVGAASFDGATFVGSASSFDRATFVGSARFRGATFTTEAQFSEVAFMGLSRVWRRDFRRRGGVPQDEHRAVYPLDQNIAVSVLELVREKILEPFPENLEQRPDTRPRSVNAAYLVGARLAVPTAAPTDDPGTAEIEIHSDLLFALGLADVPADITT